MFPFNRLWCKALRNDQGGRLLKRHEVDDDICDGLIRVKEERDQLTGRHMQVARLHHAVSKHEVRSPLLDTRILLLDEHQIVLTGLQRDVLTRKDTAQTWMLAKAGEPINRLWCHALRNEVGAPVPRWLQATGVWHEGHVRVREEFDEAAGRHMLIARLIQVGRGLEVRPPLLDARLLLLNDDRLVLTGLQRDDLTGMDTAQAWLLVKDENRPQGAGAAAT